MALIPGVRKILASDISGAPAWFEQVVGIINSFLDVTIGALRGKLTLADNMYGEIKEFMFEHGVEQQIYFSRVNSYAGLLILKTPEIDSDDVAITAWRARTVKPNTLGLKIFFQGGAGVTGVVKFIILG